MQAYLRITWFSHSSVPLKTVKINRKCYACIICGVHQ